MPVVLLKVKAKMLMPTREKRTVKALPPPVDGARADLDSYSNADVVAGCVHDTAL